MLTTRYPPRNVTLGDAAAKTEGEKSGFGGLQKVKAQRMGPPTFDAGLMFFTLQFWLLNNNSF